MSRVAMLDIFVAVFVLIALSTFYLYLERNRFSRLYSEYSKSWLLLLVAFFSGTAIACKLSGLFLFIFYLGFYLFYFQGAVRKRIVSYSWILLGSLYVYIFLATLFLKGDFYETLLRIKDEFVFHNSAMLPINVQKAEGGELLSGGIKALGEFFFWDKQYLLQKNGYLPLAYSNNRLIPLTILAFSLIVGLQFIVYLMEMAKTKKAKLPLVLRDFPLLYCFFAALVFILPWGVFPRVQYIYYFIPAFPFIKLFTVRYLTLYQSRLIKTIYCLIYLLIFLLGVRLVVPI
jgi:hypothetical protein